MISSYKKLFSRTKLIVSSLIPMIALAACMPAKIGDPREPEIPNAKRPTENFRAMNNARDAIIRVPLGEDVLVPQAMPDDPLPNVVVGPYELRNETLASALQLVLDDYNISIAFESDLGMTRRITVSNLRGKLDNVVDNMCAIANLYCHHNNGVLTVKETETFIVDLPPIISAREDENSSNQSSSNRSNSDGEDDDPFEQIAKALGSIVGGAPSVDKTTRVMIYNANQRSNAHAKKFFDRLRKNTALIVFETHIWEVALDNENRTGIDWQGLLNTGNFDINFNMNGGVTGGTSTPITISPSYTGSKHLTAEGVFQFLATHGAVKTVSQPQLTVLSGSSATLAVQQNENYVSTLSRTLDDNNNETIAATTDTVTTGLRMTVSSAWDRATVYGTLDISLDELLEIQNFSPSADNIIQLPRTTSRALQTQIRVRPGDAILIGGLVTERDNFDKSGLGWRKPLIPTSRVASTQNAELVFLLRPRVIAYIDQDQWQKESMNDQGATVSLPTAFDQTPTPFAAPVSGLRPETLHALTPVSKENLSPPPTSEETFTPLSWLPGSVETEGEPRQ